MTSKKTNVVVAVDFGGTNTKIAQIRGTLLFDVQTEKTEAVESAAAFVTDYVADLSYHAKSMRLFVSAAGEVEDDSVHLTNQDLRVEARTLSRIPSISSVSLFNDFEAVAWSLGAMSNHQLKPIGGGAAIEDAPVAILGPGTGLGVALRIKQDDITMVIPTEGGHGSMPASSSADCAFLAAAYASHPHISPEDILSGRGFVMLYETIATMRGKPAQPLSPQEITQRAIEDACPICVEAFAMFWSFLGNFAGNQALSLGARGGIYMAGGIVPKFLEHIDSSAFRDSFEGKGRFADYLKRIPVFVVTHPQPELVGLAVLSQQPAPVAGK